MKISVLVISCCLLLVCCAEETPKTRLLEFKINGQLHSYEGYAYRYTDVENGVDKGFDWHIYNLGQKALYMQAYDTTFDRLVFPYPEFQAKYTVELSQGATKTYEATSGRFRLLGTEMGDIRGDFYFTLKNITNPDDSLVFTAGYFRIWLEKKDRTFPK